MRDYLKVKVLSLTAEAKIIRREELRALKNRNLALSNTEYYDNVYHGLRNHRVNDVREEARSSFLAYGFLLGNSYQKMEHNAYTEPDFLKIRKMVMRYGEGDTFVLEEQLNKWEGDARVYLYKVSEERKKLIETLKGYPNEKEV